MFLLLATLSFAGSRCVATWEAATPGCALQGELTTSATAGSEEAAQREALRRLRRVTELAGQDVGQSLALQPGEFALCPDAAVEQAELACTPQRARNDGDYCFVVFDDPDCWTGEVLTVDHGGWRAVVEGRQRMCDAVDARQVALEYTDNDSRRAECRTRCLTETVVSCPPVR